MFTRCSFQSPNQRFLNSFPLTNSSDNRQGFFGEISNPFFVLLAAKGELKGSLSTVGNQLPTGSQLHLLKCLLPIKIPSQRLGPPPNPVRPLKSQEPFPATTVTTSKTLPLVGKQGFHGERGILQSLNHAENQSISLCGLKIAIYLDSGE